MQGTGCVQHRALDKDSLVFAWPVYLPAPPQGSVVLQQLSACDF